ncbi:MAG: hypothetical protein IPM24_28530 [Bryobacterales bacterium]|nr:hypothetical protein [Bryobacterales bacterium]
MRAFRLATGLLAGTSALRTSSARTVAASPVRDAVISAGLAARATRVLGSAPASSSSRTISAFLLVQPGAIAPSCRSEVLRAGICPGTEEQQA